jgi:hypothetical protein
MSSENDTVIKGFNTSSNVVPQNNVDIERGEFRRTKS